MADTAARQDSPLPDAAPPSPPPLARAPLPALRPIPSLRPAVHLSLDVETTGLSSWQDRVVSVSLVEVSGRGLGARVEGMVNPGRPIPAETTAIHGIHDRDVRDRPFFLDVARDLAEFVGDRPRLATTSASTSSSSSRSSGARDCPCRRGCWRPASTRCASSSACAGAG